MSERNETGVDPELGKLLGDPRAHLEPSANLDAMYAVITKDIAAADKQPLFWLRSRPTFVRRTIGIGVCALVITAVALWISNLHPGTFSPMRFGLAMGSLGTLLFVSVYQALRPFHRPPMAWWARALVIGLTLACTFMLALMPSAPDAPRSAVLPSMVSACTFIGLLAGVPVYLVLRLFERGRSAGALVGACAAGLIANLALEIHCPRADMVHLMASHFGVAMLFVVGLGASHLILERLRR